MRTPKSAKKAAKAETAAVESVTPVKMKTPKKPKTPKAEIAAADTPSKKDSPKAPNTPQAKAENGAKANGDAKSTGGRRRAMNRERNPKAVYMFFESDVSTGAAKALIKKFSDAEALSFGRGFIVRFDDEAKAAEVRAAAANKKFAGVKPVETSTALEIPKAEKRSLPDDEEASKESLADVKASPKKKRKGKKSKKVNTEKAEENDE